MSKHFITLLMLVALVFGGIVQPVQAQSVLHLKIQLPDGAHPYDIAVDSIHHKAYVLTLSPNKMYVVDTLSDIIIAQVTLSNEAYGIAVDSNQNKVFISNYDDNSISVLDGETYTIVNIIYGSFYRPQVMTVHENANRLYVTNDLGSLSSSVTVVDSSLETVVGTIPTGAGPFGLAVNSQTNRLYITSSGYNSGLQVIDTESNNVVASLPLPSSIQSVAVDTNLNRVYVVNQFGGSVYAIDGTTIEVIETIYLNQQYSLNPIGLVVDSELHKAYVGNHSGSNIGANISIIDTTTNSLLEALPVAESLGSFRNVVYLDLDTELHKVYAALHNDSSIAVIVEPNNHPIANAGGPYICIEGNLCTFNGSNSSDPDAGDTIANYEWDFDYDGVSFTIDGSGTALTMPTYSYAEAPGAKTVALRIMDNHGSTSAISTAIVTIIYDFTGFFQPVDALPVLNAVKAGQPIPIKFSLGGFQGYDVLAIGYPTSTEITCGTTAEDAIEQTATPGLSNLSYDAGSHQYTYVWKTDKAWASTCRTLVLKLNDGTYHRANFKFK